MNVIPGRAGRQGEAGRCVKKVTSVGKALVLGAALGFTHPSLIRPT